MSKEAAVEFLENLQSSIEADLIIINTAISPGVENIARAVIEARADKRENAFVILVTEGGDADAAYQIGAILQNAYKEITICVAGWCKSAGTLIALCADRLVLGPRGQLGPIDVQIAKRDELGDRDSGLVLSAALTSLAEQSFSLFEHFMMEIKNRSGGAVTFKTAADIATRLTIGMMAPIFEKIDPVRMGADQRAQNVARDYAIRLNLRPGNLKDDSTLNMLLNGYSSHSFVIDHTEAERLFTNVEGLDDHTQLAVAMLGEYALVPQDKPLFAYVDGVVDAGEEAVETEAEGAGDGPVEQVDNGDESADGEGIAAEL